MRKTVSSVLLVSSISIFAQAEALKAVEAPESKVRLVVSGDLSMSSAQSMGRTSSASQRAQGLSTLEVEASEADAMIELLKQQPGVRAVERDLMTSTPPMPKISPEDIEAMSQQMQARTSAALSGDQPNDPEYINQFTWEAANGIYEGQNDVLRAYKLSQPARKMRIGMVDSGFYDREDINYAGGYNFATIGGGSVSPIFYEDAYNPGCTEPHGGAVAHIIGANTDNGVGVAGMVDADLYAVRVMDCGSGLLSEMATGIRWLAGDTSISGATPISTPVDMINASMGAPAINQECPTYVQDAINFAYNRGIAVFVAAGNASIDVQDYTPANCDNVITVGSVNRQGYQSSFTNYGSGVDVSALGEMVMSEGTSGYSYWSGTSFATPNTVGIAALIRQEDPSMTVDVLFNYVKSTTRAYSSGKTQNALGTGIMDAYNMVQTFKSNTITATPRLSPALDSSERCQKAALAGVPFMDDNGDPVEACAIFEVDATLVPDEVGFPNRVLYRIPEGGSYDRSGATRLTYSTDDKFVAYNLDPQNYDYGLALCDAGNVSCSSTTLMPLSDDEIDSSRYCVKP